MSLIGDILEGGAKAFIRAALTDFLNREVKKGLITQTQAAYIVEGAVDAVALGFNEYEASQAKT